jgi:hypothetical protein
MIGRQQQVQAAAEAFLGENEAVADLGYIRMYAEQLAKQPLSDAATQRIREAVAILREVYSYEAARLGQRTMGGPPAKANWGFSVSH